MGVYMFFPAQKMQTDELQKALQQLCNMTINENLSFSLFIAR